MLHFCFLCHLFVHFCAIDKCSFLFNNIEVYIYEVVIMKQSPVLWIIIPCYNEEAVLPVTTPVFLEELQRLTDDHLVSPDSRILFVNDGSKDRTWELIETFSREDPHVMGICQSRNRGHQNAVLAGLMEAKDYADLTISIDCDGQDDPHAMHDMVKAYLDDGCEIVYGVRSDRSTDTWFKRTTAQSYYRFLNRMGVEAVYNHADYRLVSSRVLQSFADFREVNIFLRGMFPLVGFKSTSVYYARAERKAGTTHYPLGKMLSLAFDGITSLSVRPIHLIALCGGLVSCLGIIGIIWAIAAELTGHTVSGWASTICIICLFGGLQLLSLGVIGEYVGKTYLETKKRPRYIISDRTDNVPQSSGSSDNDSQS